MPCCQPSATLSSPPAHSNTRPVTWPLCSLPSHTTIGLMLAGSMASKPDSTGAIISAKASSVMRLRAEGAMELAVTPMRPSSAAMLMVKAAMPALAEA